MKAFPYFLCAAVLLLLPLRVHAETDYGRRIAQYTKAIEANAKDAVAFKNRGDAYHDRDSSEDDYSAAVVDYTESIRRHDKFAEAYKNRADAYEKLGQSSNASADRRKYEELIKTP